MAEEPNAPAPSAFDELEALQRSGPDARERANEALVDEDAETSRKYQAQGTQTVELSTEEFSRMIFDPTDDPAAHNQWQEMRHVLTDTVTALRDGPEAYEMANRATFENLALESYVDAQGRPVVGLRAVGGEAVLHMLGKEHYRLAEGSRILEIPPGEDNRVRMRVWDAATFEQQREQLGLREAPPRQFPFDRLDHPQPQEGHTMDNEPSNATHGAQNSQVVDIDSALKESDIKQSLHAMLRGAPELKGRLRKVGNKGEAALYVDGDAPLRIQLDRDRVLELPPGAALYLREGGVEYLPAHHAGIPALAELWRRAVATASAQPDTDVAAASEAPREDAAKTDAPAASSEAPSADSGPTPPSNTNQSPQQSTNKAAQQVGGGLGSIGAALTTAVGHAVGGLSKAVGAGAKAGATVGVAGIDALKTRNTNKTALKIAKTNARAAKAGAAALHPPDTVLGRCRAIADHCDAMDTGMAGLHEHLSQKGLANTPYEKMTPEQQSAVKSDPQVRAHGEQITSHGDAVRELASPEFTKELAALAGDRSLSVADQQRVQFTLNRLEQTRKNIDGRYRDLPVGRDKRAKLPKGKKADEPVSLSDRFKELTKRLREVVEKVMAAVASVLGKKRTAPSPGA